MPLSYYCRYVGENIQIIFILISARDQASFIEDSRCNISDFITVADPDPGSGAFLTPGSRILDG